MRWTLSKSLCPALFQRFFDNNGAPLAGGLVYTYASGTTTPLGTFTDEGGLTPNANPIVLDAYGYADIWLGDTAYKFIVNDANDVLVREVDPVQSLAAQIAAAIVTAGALAVVNNLSDLASVASALVNLGIAPFSYPLSHTTTSGQSAANLTGETFDGTLLSSVVYNYEILLGTTVKATGDFSVHYLNGTWVFYDGMARGTAHGITFSLSQATTIGQLKAAESGLGNEIVKLKRHYFFA